MKHLSALIFLCLFAPVFSADAWAQPSAGSTERRAINPDDTLRGLVVFVRFRDDRGDWSDGCARSATEWAAPERLPGMARTILHPRPEGPFPDSSLTDYFYRQSNGNFVLYGETHPEVYTTRHDEAHYGRLNQQGLGMLTDEIMEAVAGRYDFSEFDANGTGYIDQVMFIIRSMRQPPGYGGIASLGRADYARRYNGKTLHPQLGGFFLIWQRPYNVHPQVDLIRWMAHEFGHNLWDEFRGSHLNPILDNDVPHASSIEDDRPHRVVGYALMLGAGPRSGDIGGMNTISAYERSLLAGWISCAALDEDRTVVLQDLYTSSASNCAFISLGNDASNRRIFLSNLQRTGYFNRNHRPPSAHCDGCFPIDQGLMATGLFVELVEGSGRRAARDFVPANNAANAPTDCQWPHAHQVYGGNAFAEGSQLTPWTRPNINGFTHYPAGFEPAWQAIDNIRYGRNGNVTLDYVRDFRDGPILRSDSWIGSESENETIRGTMQIMAGATLEIANTTLNFDREAQIMVEGTLVLDGATLTSEETSWRGITVARGGVVRVDEGSRLSRMEREIEVRPGGTVEISPGVLDR